MFKTSNPIKAVFFFKLAADARRNIALTCTNSTIRTCFCSRNAFENPSKTRGYGATLLAIHKLAKAGIPTTWEAIQESLNKNSTSNNSSRSAYVYAGFIKKNRKGHRVTYDLTQMGKMYLAGWLGFEAL